MFSSELSGTEAGGETAPPNGAEWTGRTRADYIFYNLLRSYWEYCYMTTRKMFEFILERIPEMYNLFTYISAF